MMLCILFVVHMFAFQ